MRNKTANIYTEWLPLLKSLSREVRGDILLNILEYQNGEDIICDNPIWIFIKSKLDDFNSKGKKISEKNRANAKKGWIKRTNSIACDGMRPHAMDAIKENKIKEKKIKENIPYLEDNIICWWNTYIANNFRLPQIKRMTDTRLSSLKKRIKECGGVDSFKSIIETAFRESPFLTGDNKQGWSADFDFCLQAKSFTKMAESGYAKKSKTMSMFDKIGKELENA